MGVCNRQIYDCIKEALIFHLLFYFLLINGIGLSWLRSDYLYERLDRSSTTSSTCDCVRSFVRCVLWRSILQWSLFIMISDLRFLWSCCNLWYSSKDQKSKQQQKHERSESPHYKKNARWRSLFVFSSVFDGWLRWRRRRWRWWWRWLWIVINYHSVKASSFLLLLLLFDFLRSMIYQQPNEGMYIVCACACACVCVSTCVILLSIYIMNIWQNFA